MTLSIGIYVPFCPYESVHQSWLVFLTNITSNTASTNKLDKNLCT